MHETIDWESWLKGIVTTGVRWPNGKEGGHVLPGAEDHAGLGHTSFQSGCPALCSFLFY